MYSFSMTGESAFDSPGPLASAEQVKPCALSFAKRSAMRKMRMTERTPRSDTCQTLLTTPAAVCGAGLCATRGTNSSFELVIE